MVKALKHLHARPVENSVGPGTPDVTCTAGWIELKWMRRWPARPDTKVIIEHYTKKQKWWLRDRWNAGGGAWLLLQVGREYMLFEAPEAQLVHDGLTRGELYKHSAAHWKNGLDGKELGRCLINGNLAILRAANGTPLNVAATD